VSKKPTPLSQTFQCLWEESSWTRKSLETYKLQGGFINQPISREQLMKQGPATRLLPLGLRERLAVILCGQLNGKYSGLTQAWRVGLAHSPYKLQRQLLEAEKICASHTNGTTVQQLVAKYSCHYAILDLRFSHLEFNAQSERRGCDVFHHSSLWKTVTFCVTSAFQDEAHRMLSINWRFGKHCSCNLWVKMATAMFVDTGNSQHSTRIIPKSQRYTQHLILVKGKRQ
jgi:hypothetical protein